MGRSQNTMGRGFDILWVGVQNTRSWGFNIPWIGRGVKNTTDKGFAIL